ncbi:hypothetical protein [Methylomagnum sp.]
MRALIQTAVLVASLACGGAWAYGGGGGSSGCEEPKFLQLTPSGTVASLTEFSFIATDKTDAATLVVEVNGQKVTPVIDKQRNGDYAVKVALPQPIDQPGRVRIGISASGREGCAGFQPYYLEVKP